MNVDVDIGSVTIFLFVLGDHSLLQQFHVQTSGGDRLAELAATVNDLEFV